MCMNLVCINTFFFYTDETCLNIEVMIKLVESPAHSSDEAQNYAISSGRAFGSFKRKAEDDKYLKIVYKLSDILRGKIERETQRRRKKQKVIRKREKKRISINSTNLWNRRCSIK